MGGQTAPLRDRQRPILSLMMLPFAAARKEDVAAAATLLQAVQRRGSHYVHFSDDVLDVLSARAALASCDAGVLNHISVLGMLRAHIP